MTTIEPTRYDFPPKTPESRKRPEFLGTVLALLLVLAVGLGVGFIARGLHDAPAQKPDMGITIGNGHSQARIDQYGFTDNQRRTVECLVLTTETAGRSLSCDWAGAQ